MAIVTGDGEAYPFEGHDRASIPTARTPLVGTDPIHKGLSYVDGRAIAAVTVVPSGPLARVNTSAIVLASESPRPLGRFGSGSDGARSAGSPGPRSVTRNQSLFSAV